MTTRKKKSRLPRAFRVESLEGRRLLAADLDAAMLADQQNDTSSSATSDVDPGNSLREALQVGTIRGHREFENVVGATDRLDVFQFDIATAENVDIVLSELSGDANLWLANAETRRFEAFSINREAQDERISADLASGSYVLAVSFAGSGQTHYHLSVDVPISDNGGSSIVNARTLPQLGVSDAFSDYIGHTDKEDYYRFSLNEAAEVRIIVDQLPANTRIHLLEGRTNEVRRATIDDSQTELVMNLAEGEYFIQVTSESANTAFYEFRIAKASADGSNTDYGNSIDTAYELNEAIVIHNLRGRIGGDNQLDVFRLDVTREANYSTRVYDFDQNLNLYVFSANERSIQSGQLDGEFNRQWNGTLDVGTHYFVVASFGTSTPFELQISRQNEFDYGGNDFDSAGNVSTDNRAVVGQLNAVNTADFLTFTLDAASDVNISLNQLDASSTLVLFDGDRQRISTHIATQETFDAVGSALTVSKRLAAGEYFVQAYVHGLNATNYELQVNAERLPNEFAAVADFGTNIDWNLNSILAPEVWQAGYVGQDVLVAVLDTGVDYLHPDLASQIFVNAGEIANDGIDNDGNGFVDDFRGWDFVGNDNSPLDVNGHGTHVAGTIAAARNEFGTTGVAYGAKILPVQVLSSSGSGNFFSVAAGIRYAVDMGADVINLSLGGGYTRTVQNAVRYAVENDVIVVAASGNDSNAVPGFPARFAAIYDSVISVGAHDRNDRAARFSNGTGNSSAVQIDAPGVGIVSTYPNRRYNSLNGTSMAAPHVAGVAALTISANPNLSSAEVRELLAKHSTRSIAGSDSIGGVNASRIVANAVLAAYA